MRAAGGGVLTLSPARVAGWCARRLDRLLRSPYFW